MTAYTIEIPSSLRLVPSIKFVESLNNLPQAKEYLVDFSRMKWVEPFGMLLVSNKIRQIAREGKIKIKAIGGYTNDYAAHMGFYKAQGIGYGNSPGEARGSSHYLPITNIEIKHLKDKARKSVREVGWIVEEEARKLAQILSQEKDGELVAMLTFSFREIMRNVVEHSQSPFIQYCAQYWHKQHLVEIVILDAGVGVKKSLSRNPYLEIKDDKDALQLSLIPGISGNMYRGKKTDPTDCWQNSGFGLYMTSRLCSNGGSFFIGSGDKGVLLRKKNKSIYKGSFEGTVLRLKIRTDHKETLRQQLSRFSKEGTEIAKKYHDNEHVSASRASRMLSEDFKLE